MAVVTAGFRFSHETEYVGGKYRPTNRQRVTCLECGVTTDGAIVRKDAARWAVEHALECAQQPLFDAPARCAES